MKGLVNRPAFSPHVQYALKYNTNSEEILKLALDILNDFWKTASYSGFLCQGQQVVHIHWGKKHYFLYGPPPSNILSEHLSVETSNGLTIWNMGSGVSVDDSR